MDSDSFDLGEFSDIGWAETVDHAAQRDPLGLCEGADTGHHGMRGEVDEPLDFDADSFAVEGGLGEVIDERSDGSPIAPVEGSEGDLGLDVTKGSHACIFPDGREAAVSQPRRSW